MNDLYNNITIKLNDHVTTIENLDEWLFIAVNTMKAIVDNSCKDDIEYVLKATECSSTAEIQRLYDTIQGKYGREGFSYRNAQSYYYLSSLVAKLSDVPLTDSDRERIAEYYLLNDYLLYAI